MKYNVLSCFDGIGCGITSLKKSNVNFENYYASEIDNDAMKIASYNHPEIKHVGDIRFINRNTFNHNIDIIIGGSPCQGFSLAGRRLGMSNIQYEKVTTLKQYLKLKNDNFQFIGQSYLFWEFVRLIKELKPKYFFLENVRMSKEWENIITYELNVLPITINSSLVSIQNRLRLYWTNIPNVTIPQNQNIVLHDVIPNAIGGHGKRGFDKGVKKPNGNIKWIMRETTRKDNKINCITTNRGGNDNVKLSDNTIRKLTITEAEIAQTLPINYTNVPKLSLTKRWKGIGNGWTINVISHIFNNLKT